MSEPDGYSFPGNPTLPGETNPLLEEFAQLSRRAATLERHTVTLEADLKRAADDHARLQQGYDLLAGVSDKLAKNGKVVSAYSST